jgi:hypothetical protein
MLVVFDISDAANRFVVACQSEYIFWQFASNLNWS